MPNLADVCRIGPDFTRLPRGSYRATVNRCEIDLWPFCDAPGLIVWRWTVADVNTQRYVAAGRDSSLEFAQRAAIAKAEGR